MPDYYFELRRGQTEAIQLAQEIFAALCVEYEELSGRSYGPFEAYRLDDAETALVCLGSSTGTAKDVVDALRTDGEAVGLLEICSFRPFPAEVARAVLANARTVAVLDRADSPGGAPRSLPTSPRRSCPTRPRCAAMSTGSADATSTPPTSAPSSTGRRFTTSASGA